MRIVNHHAFLLLEPGTLFSKVTPNVFDPLQIKGETLWHEGTPIDFSCQDIADALDCSGSEEFNSLIEDSLKEGRSIPLNFECEGRDGCYDEDQLFAVWEGSDVEALIERLQETLSMNGGPY